MNAVIDPFIPSARVRAVVFALVVIGFAVTAFVADVAAPSSRGYPPLFGTLVAQIAPLVWFFANVAMLFGVYVEWRRIYRSLRVQPAPGWLVLATAIAVAVPSIAAMLNGDAGVLLLYAIMLGFSFALCGQDRLDWTAGGVVLAIPAAIQLPMVIVGAAVVLGFVARESKRGVTLTVAYAIGLALWLVAIPELVFGSAAHIDVAPRSVALFAVAAVVLLVVARRASPLELTVVFGVTCIAVAGSAGFTLALPFLGAAPLLLLDRGKPRAAQWLAMAGMMGMVAVHAM
ncbi:MAG TPA: hypothetical protein VGF48_00905 [Thermoanaerobaculia bacterium]|jgi:hypothetical protein